MSLPLQTDNSSGINVHPIFSTNTECQGLNIQLGGGQVNRACQTDDKKIKKTFPLRSIALGTRTRSLQNRQWEDLLKNWTANRDPRQRLKYRSLDAHHCLSLPNIFPTRLWEFLCPLSSQILPRLSELFCRPGTFQDASSCYDNPSMQQREWQCSDLSSMFEHVQQAASSFRLSINADDGRLVLNNVHCGG